MESRAPAPRSAAVGDEAQPTDEERCLMGERILAQSELSQFLLAVRAAAREHVSEP